MLRKILLRGSLGTLIGVSVGYLITIILSLCWGHGHYSACVPQLIDIMDSEISAVILQTFLCALLGASFAASSVIWEIESWSILKQSGLYFLISSVVMMPIAYFLYWMEHSVIGFIKYFGVFTLIFIIVWLIQYIIMLINIKNINQKL